MRKKRILAVLMAVLMIVTLLPSMAFAAEAGELGGKLKVKGLPAVGTVLSADYSKVTPEGVTDDDVIFSWREGAYPGRYRKNLHSDSG